MCEQLTVWDVHGLEKVLRVCFVPVWRTAEEAYDMVRCSGCKEQWFQAPFDRSRLVADREAGLEETIGAMTADEWARHEEREAVWARIEAGQETPEDRVAWLEVVLTRLWLRSWKWGRRTMRDRWVWLALGSVPVLAVLAAVLSYWLTPNRNTPLAPMHWPTAMIGGALIGCVGMVVAHATAPRRFLKREWRVWLRDRLAAVRFSAQELDQAWGELVKASGEMPGRLKPGVLWAYQRLERSNPSSQRRQA